MKQFTAPEIKEVMESVNTRPAISIILPFEPKMSLRSELAHSLKSAADKVEKEIARDYPHESGALVMRKLRSLIEGLNFDTYKKSIAIYVSPLFEKVLYLDIPVEERIQVDNSFEIRDLVYAKKQLHKYLVLLLSYNECIIYMGDTTTFVNIVTNSSSSISQYINDVPERVANFSDMSERKEVMMDKYLRYIDNGLDLILNAYRLPLFVVGTPKITGHFKKLTKHTGSIVGYVEGNYEEAGVAKLKEVLEPHVSDWRSVMTKDLLNRLDDAYGKNKLATGIKEAWRESMNDNGRLLVVEKNFVFPAVPGNKYDVIHEVTEPFNKITYIQDAVDKIIEKVLESGGDVEFVDAGLLEQYGNIALVQYH
jgi:hypothetical protein